MIDTDAIKARFEALEPVLDERERRLFAASEARAAGHGGVIAVSRATGIARVALHTGAAVVPGYAVWDERSRKYQLRFEPPVELIRTGDMGRDVLENTKKFTKVIEEIVRKYPEQWVWVHGRWNTRPKGEPSLYDFQ